MGRSAEPPQIDRGGIALFRSVFETPFGHMQLTVDEDGTLVEVWLPERGPRFSLTFAIPPRAREAARIVQLQLCEYFAGKRRSFDMPFAPRGSAFEREVWNRLCDISYGATTSYGAIASAMRLVNGARAVGRANGSNPIPIIIPCHRVIGMGGQLTGYGGGLPLKQALLELEGAIPPPAPRLF